MTLTDAEVIAIQYLNKYSVRGTLVSTSDPIYKDFILRMPPLANTIQQELAKVSKISGKYSISKNVIPNLLSNGDEEVQHFPGVDDTYTAEGAESFSIEINDNCVLYFYETISGVLTPINGMYSKDGGTATAFTGSIAVTGISDTGTETFPNYKGLLTISDSSNTITLKIVTIYPMISRNRALFKYPFSTALKVPHYNKYVSYDFPTDYMKFDTALRSSDNKPYKEASDFILTPDKKIRILWSLTGQFDFYYWKKPTVITNATAGTYEFEVEEDAQALIPWYIAGYAIMPKDSSIGTQLVNQYYALRDSLKPIENAQSGGVIGVAQGAW